jgi:ubiquinone/menaquinone biosynthesis C-methylase UbiE
MEFEDIYIKLRQKEKRLYSDLQVKMLPSIEFSHPHSNEWKARSKSATRLLKYLENKKKPLMILEVGCGNGWLSALLAGLEQSRITGSDINQFELNQAKRVFNNLSNLNFITGDLRELIFENKFDIIVFAASIQYFPDFGKTISHAMTLLNEPGEIHILDSYFYPASGVAGAATRSSTYFRTLGHETMNRFYFHHSMELVQEFNYKFLYNPANFKYRISGRSNPFPWICISA